MKFRYFLCFSVSLELTLGDYSLGQANSSSLNDSFGEDLLQCNSCVIATLFLSFDILFCLFQVATTEALIGEGGEIRPSSPCFFLFKILFRSFDRF